MDPFTARPCGQTRDRTSSMPGSQAEVHAWYSFSACDAAAGVRASTLTGQARRSPTSEFDHGGRILRGAREPGHNLCQALTRRIWATVRNVGQIAQLPSADRLLDWLL